MFKLIAKISAGQRGGFWRMVGLSALSSILEGFGVSLIVPIFQKLLNVQAGGGALEVFLDRAIRSLGMEPTLTNTLILFNIAFIGKTILALISKWNSTQIASGYYNHTQVRLFDSVLSANLGFFQKNKQGAVTNALSMEIQRTASLFVACSNWISNVITAVIYFLIAIKVSWILAMVAGLLGIVCLYPLRYVNKKASFYGKKWTAGNESVQNLLTETVIGIKFIKASGYDSAIQKQFSDISKGFAATWSRISYFSNLTPLVAQPAAVFILSVLLSLGVAMQIPVIEILLFMFALQRLIPALSAVTTYQNEIHTNQPALEATERMKQLAIDEAEKSGSMVTPIFSQKIKYESVEFRHSPNVPLLENVNLEFAFGETIALIGPSGSGKTTLVDLLLGLYRPQRGRVTMDGHNIVELSLKGWREQLAYVTQETFMFHDTILNNLKLIRPTATKDEIVAACKLSHAHDFIGALELGYDTMVGDRGGKLSGGQKQRLALARALLSNPRVLILDEATSALDFESENLIKDAIARLKEQRKMTIIIIAHRISTTEVADKVIDLGQLKS